MHIDITYPAGWDAKTYALLDSGEGYKLERFGGLTLARPDPQAIWQRHRSPAEWEAADATYSREGDDETSGRGARWATTRDLPETWPMRWRDLTFLARLTPFKHTGVFPEQAAHWDWLTERIAASQGTVRVLNLFGYTGIASLVAAKAGAQVTHLDASPKTIEWAKENQALSGLDQASIRWLTDDALKFVRREARRGSTYEIIVMDPPAFGRGPKGEVWKFESSLPELLDACRVILSERPLGIVINSYSIRASALLLRNLLDDMMRGFRVEGTTSAGELALPEQGESRTLATAIYARWQS